MKKSQVQGSLFRDPVPSNEEFQMPRHFSMFDPVSRMIERLFPVIAMRLSDALKARRSDDVPAQIVRMWWNRVLFNATMIALLCPVLGVVMKDVTWAVTGLFGFVAYVILSYRREVGKLQRYRDQIAYELPEFVQIVVIYLYAGFTVAASVKNAADRRKHSDSPMSELLRESSRQLSLQTPIAQVLHRMAVEADTNDMKSIVTVLLTHTTRGGEAMIDTLLEICRQMWHKRLSLVRRKAEETTVLMIFPMILIFASILLIVGAPAVMFMKL